MVIDGWMITLSIFILGLVWKAATSHNSSKELGRQVVVLREDDTKSKNRINKLEEEQIRIIEALERSYASKELVYGNFVTSKDHGLAMSRLEEKLVAEMKHMNETLQQIRNALQKGT